MPRKKYPANVVGPQIRKLRGKLGLTQEELAANCQLAGLDISRSTLGQIEARLRVCDGRGIDGRGIIGGRATGSTLPGRIAQALSREKVKTQSWQIRLSPRSWAMTKGRKKDGGRSEKTVARKVGAWLHRQ